MQVLISINHIGQCTLPISYHHIQQSAIYALIMGELHDHGLAYEKRDYKLFTFGPFNGKYHVQNKHITFFDSISFEVRFVNEQLAENFVNNLQTRGFRLGDVTYHDVVTQLNCRAICENSLMVKMLSPICVYQTDENKHTHYLNPGDKRFCQYIEDNFERKYQACYGVKPTTGIRVTNVKFSPKDKYFTKYKNYFIEAWYGLFLLDGEPEYLTFLYDSGLGSKNSQGFGMYEPIERRQDCVCYPNL